MSFLPASRTKRLLIKVASLGLAGFLAGLFSGCTNASADTRHTQLSSNPSVSDTSSEAKPSQLPRSLDETQIPALRHPPSARRLQLGSVPTASMAMVPNGHNRS
jgi:hypothetical protein